MLDNPWSAVRNSTSALGPSGSSFDPSGLAPTGIHHFLLSHLTTGSNSISWLGSRVVSVLDSGAEGPGSNRSSDAVG